MQGLPQKQTKAIVSLLNCRTVSEAATQAGVNESTVWRWMREESFQDALQEAKQRIVTQAIIQLQQATGEAVGTLRSIMDDGEAPASSRVTAAKTVLDMAVKAIKMEDLEARLMTLEDRKESLFS
jgi:hypothetical protein